MGRERRNIDPDRAYHVVCRGSNRGQIAWDDHDFESLVRELDKAASRHRWQVLSWVCLHTHYHVVLRTPEGGFSEGFHVMNGSHSRRTNRRWGRTDHLFRNRPRARLIRSDAHLVTAILYVARNPLKAGICRHPAQWRHGSYRGIVGLDAAPAWLAVAEVLRHFGSDTEAARLEFTRLILSGHLPVSDTEEELLLATSE